MQMKNYLAPCLILLMFLMASCEQEGGGGDPETPSLKILSPSNISETGFQVNWSLNTLIGFTSISVEVFGDKEMEIKVKYLESGDISTEYLLVSDLKGATQYYYRISMLNNGIPVFKSEIKKAETSFRMDNIDLVTEDNYTLSSKLTYLESVSGSRPGIILMHEFGVWVNPWIGSDLMKQLVAEGYVCLTFFFRGHGTSTPVDDLMALINDKSLLAKDLKAAIEYLNGHELVSTGELGLMGGSMGAIMALAGNGYEEVKTSVALSPGSDGVFVIFPDMTLTSAYYLVGELDIHDEPDVNFPAETSTLYELTEEPRKLDIIPGTSDHGTNLLVRDSLNTSIREWILERLPLQ
jgi:dienelactone hydrolase